MGWATAALAAYGCRPAEVFSLFPGDDGTASVLTVTRKGKQPTWRTALALLQSWPEEFGLGSIRRPWDCRKPDAATVRLRRLVEQWGRWLRRKRHGIQLYDLRHACAVREALESLPSSNCRRDGGMSLNPCVG